MMKFKDKWNVIRTYTSLQRYISWGYLSPPLIDYLLKEKPAKRTDLLCSEAMNLRGLCWIKN